MKNERTYAAANAISNIYSTLNLIDAGLDGLKGLIFLTSVQTTVFSAESVSAALTMSACVKCMEQAFMVWVNVYRRFTKTVLFTREHCATTKDSHVL